MSLCKGHSGAIKQFDFSLPEGDVDPDSGDMDDGIVLRSVDAGHIKELLYWNVHTGKQMSVMNKVRDLKWSTQGCTAGWSVQVSYNDIFIVWYTVCLYNPLL